MCLLPDFVVWRSRAEKAAPPQPSRSHWEPSHRDKNDSSGHCSQEEDWKIVSLLSYESLNVTHNHVCHHIIFHRQLHSIPADTDRDKQTVRQTDSWLFSQTDRWSFSQTGTCTVRWWASRSSTPAAAASGLQLSYCSDPLWGPQTAARPPLTWWWRECEWLNWAII